MPLQFIESGTKRLFFLTIAVAVQQLRQGHFVKRRVGLLF